MRTINQLVVHRSEAGLTGREVATHEPQAYHLFIRQNGQVDWALHPWKSFDLGFEQPGQHAIGHNAHSIGIAVYGCFDEAPDSVLLCPPPRNLHPTQEQLDSLYTLCAGLAWWVGSGTEHKVAISGHTELPDATAFPGKVCPGRHLDMGLLRTWISKFEFRNTP